MKLTKYHFNFLAKEIAPMIQPVYIRNGKFTEAVQTFSRNPNFNKDTFAFVSSESWENQNIKPPCDPDDFGVLEKDIFPDFQDTTLLENDDDTQPEAA